VCNTGIRRMQTFSKLAHLIDYGLIFLHIYSDVSKHSLVIFIIGVKRCVNFYSRIKRKRIAHVQPFLSFGRYNDQLVQY